MKTAADYCPQPNPLSPELIYQPPVTAVDDRQQPQPLLLLRKPLPLLQPQPQPLSENKRMIMRRMIQLLQQPMS